MTRSLAVASTRTSTFGQLNAEWIGALEEKQNHIKHSKALDVIQQFLFESRAHKRVVVPYPLIIAKSEYDGLVEAAGCLLSAQTRVLRHLREHIGTEKTMAMFDVPSEMAPWISWEELLSEEHVIARFDILPTDKGYRFCELNCDSSVGGYEIFECIEQYCQMLDWSLFTHGAAPHDDIVCLVKTVIENQKADRLLIVDWSTYRDLGFFGFDNLRKHLARALPDVEVQLAYEDDYPSDWLHPEDGERTVIFRGFMFADMSDGGAFYRLLHESGATVINSFEVEIRSHKKWFALFFEPEIRALLSAVEREVIDAYLPSALVVTAATSMANLEQVLKDKDKWVFKRARSSGGVGVFMGSDVELESLICLLRDGDTWLVQNYEPVQSLWMSRDASFVRSNHHIVLGLYVIGGQGNGLQVRGSNSSQMVSISSGSSSTATWAVPMTERERQVNLRLVNTW